MQKGHKTSAGCMLIYAHHHRNVYVFVLSLDVCSIPNFS
jgi:hypothetical protein